MVLLKKYFPDSLIFTFLLMIGIKISYHSQNITDVDSFDESIYLFRGTTINPFIKHHLDGFFYYAWYKVLSLFTADNSGLFFLNYSILLVLPALLIFIFLRVIKVNLLIAFVCALIFLISSANVFVIPFITKFAFCVILTGLMFIYKIKGRSSKMLAAVLLSFVMIYIRPEFIFTLFATSLLYLLLVIKNFKSGKKKSVLKEVLPLFLLILLMIFFNPVSRHRANVAFTQHYAKDILERPSKTSPDPENNTMPGEIMQEHFSTELSMSEAIMNNPKNFFEHTGYNLLRFREHLYDAFPYLVIQDDNKILFVCFYIFFTAVLLTAIYFFYKRIVKKSLGQFALIFFLFFVPPFISSIIYYPRVHYIILCIAFILIYLSNELSSRVASVLLFKKYSFHAAIISGLLTVFLLPFRAGSASIHETNCTILHTAMELNKFDFKDEVNFFAVGPGIVTFLNNDWKYVSDELFEKQFNSFVDQYNINLILVNDHFYAHPLIKTDPGTNIFLKDTAFVRIDIPGCSSFLMARKDIVK
ncbi:MAG: hypothetical protein ABI462_07885 [Ignavibacteria bacterium]